MMIDVSFRYEYVSRINAAAVATNISEFKYMHKLQYFKILLRSEKRIGKGCNSVCLNTHTNIQPTPYN